jgi:hypothetical protein
MNELDGRPLSQLIYDEISAHNLEAAIRFRAILRTSMFNDPILNEMALLNRFWRFQLARLPTPTFEERECLTDNCSMDSWIMNFKQFVIPTIIIYQLPNFEIS